MSTERTTIIDLAEAARSRIEEVTVEQLQAEMADGDVTVIDIRDIRELWEHGKIPGARSMPDGMLPFWVDPDSPYAQEGFTLEGRYVLHCAGGLRSALAADRMRELGFTNVAHLAPGFNGWREAGGEVERVDPEH
jgi:rhodanese-related sulfurtransferase